jgi:choline dehydrogenase-like flavoprotein
MLIDATDADRALFARTFDACVIGTGPAGVTLARRLSAQGFSVALMEGGGLDLEPESQALYEGEVTGLDYYPLEDARLRMFGGASMHWGGRCRALDAIDFQPRAWEALSGWPIGKADLDPYAAEADAILELVPAAEAPDLPITQSEPRFRRIQYRYSPPTRFGEKYRDEIAANPRIVCAVNANLVDMRLDDGLGRMTEARFKSFAPGDPGFAVRARVFALCCGGLENPRLMLACGSQAPNGIGNANDLVGRYFCEHPHILLGQAFFERPMPEAEVEARPEEAYAPTEALMEQHEILAFSLLVTPNLEPPLAFSTELVRSAGCVSGFTERLAEGVLGRDLNCDRGGLDMYFAQGEGRHAVQARVAVHAEQSLVRDSRVTLADTRDAFGMPKIRLDWRIGEIDYRTLETAVLELGAHYAEQGIGRVQLADWLMVEPKALPGLGQGSRVGGHHHMCATRMSADPREGVVDADCRVHGVANLYVGGSSVFATPGFANPTYTIVQLALRLGDHLGGVLRG